MRKALYYFTMSLDGYIADAQGGTAWMSGAPNTDYGYSEFYDQVETILLGRTTYEQMLDMGDFFPYADKEVIVFSANPHVKVAAESVRIESEDPCKVLARLKLGVRGPSTPLRSAQDDKGEGHSARDDKGEGHSARDDKGEGLIWVGGGATLAGSLFEAGLIDEIRAFIQPILLGAGLPFFALRRDGSPDPSASRYHHTDGFKGSERPENSPVDCFQRRTGLPSPSLHATLSVPALGQGDGSGISAKPLVWTHSHAWPAGVTELRYEVPKSWRSDL